MTKGERIEEIEYRCHQLYEPCDECKAKIAEIEGAE